MTKFQAFVTVALALLLLMQFMTLGRVQGLVERNGLWEQRIVDAIEDEVGDLADAKAKEVRLWERQIEAIEEQNEILREQGQ